MVGTRDVGARLASTWPNSTSQVRPHQNSSSDACRDLEPSQEELLGREPTKAMPSQDMYLSLCTIVVPGCFVFLPYAVPTWRLVVNVNCVGHPNTPLTLMSAPCVLLFNHVSFLVCCRFSGVVSHVCQTQIKHFKWNQRSNSSSFLTG
ncbi:hypothetical protein EDB81DRAFT_775318 [Dactylonectria macrodidyma]|uniref:Uncharacterized protein n=1 Tax=Dactylonectria macrodidyma TaxID=307937 RepID=A0A9P9FN46_9HYPO|nr:hypothetical protein EDB81DRAFT_775318 [Dactylonectria macrodidyma]